MIKHKYRAEINRKIYTYKEQIQKTAQLTEKYLALTFV